MPDVIFGHARQPDHPQRAMQQPEQECCCGGSRGHWTALDLPQAALTVDLATGSQPFFVGRLRITLTAFRNGGTLSPLLSVISGVFLLGVS